MVDIQNHKNGDVVLCREEVFDDEVMDIHILGYITETRKNQITDNIEYYVLWNDETYTMLYDADSIVVYKKLLTEVLEEIENAEA